MTQLASVIKEPRECRNCKKKKLKAFLEIEGTVIIVEKADPDPFGGSIFIHRAVFCSMKCFNEYIKKMYKEVEKGKVGGYGGK